MSFCCVGFTMEKFKKLEKYLTLFKIIFVGHTVFFLSIGFLRGNTVLLSTLEKHFSASLTRIQLCFNSAMLLGFAIGGFISGLVIGKFGVRKPSIVCSLTTFTGWALVAFLIKYGGGENSNIYLYLIGLTMVLFISLPSGIQCSCVAGSIKENIPEFGGLAVTMMCAGVSSGGLILPKILSDLNNDYA